MARSTSIIEAIDRLRQGMLLWKIRDKGVRSLKPFPRHYKLDMADLRITYLPNKNMTAKSCTAGGPGASAWIDLCDIAEVRIGHSTDTFNKLVKQVNEGLPKLDGINCARDFCFSIIFKDDTPPLDLVAHDSADRYSSYSCTLTSLIKGHARLFFSRKKSSLPSDFHVLD